jgi:hypothetical protein
MKKVKAFIVVIAMVLMASNMFNACQKEDSVRNEALLIKYIFISLQKKV